MQIKIVGMFAMLVGTSFCFGLSLQQAQDHFVKKQLEALSREHVLSKKDTSSLDAMQKRMFLILQTGLLQASKYTNDGKQEAQPKRDESSQETSATWKPQALQPLAITEQDLQWTMEEFIFELDFCIMEFEKTNEYTLRPILKEFEKWLADIDAWWQQTTFSAWVDRVNQYTKGRVACNTMLFSTKSFLFFIRHYLPAMLAHTKPAATAITVHDLQKIFPGFLLYENSKKFYFMGTAAQKQIDFLKKMLVTKSVS